jgi:hypothetical protein
MELNENTIKKGKQVIAYKPREEKFGKPLEKLHETITCHTAPLTDRTIITMMMICC